MKRLSRIIDVLASYEVYFFYAFSVINLLPVLLFDTFLTVDGPAHLYNSKIIVELITGNADFLGDFFRFNEALVPNWLGHFILSSAMLVLPALLAEKLLLITYLFLFPVSIRFLIQVVSNHKKQAVFASYFVFPFTYSFLLYFGFYNFSLGLAFLFLTIGVWLEVLRKERFTLKDVVILIALSLCVYFAHLFVFMILVAFIGISAIAQILNQKASGKEVVEYFKRAVITVAPGSILALYFILNHNVVPGNEEALSSFSESWDMIQSVQPARGVRYGKEGIFAKWVFILLALLLGNTFIVRLRNMKAPIGLYSIVFGSISTLLLIGFFLTPDDSTFIKSRILILFFLFLIIFVSAQKIHKWLKYISFLILAYVNISLLMVYVGSNREVNQYASEIIATIDHIKPNSTVLPVHESGYWLYGHSSNYLGIEKPVAILENYEAYTDYFPLQWNREQLPYLYLGDTVSTLVSYPFNADNEESTIDYLLIMPDVNNPEIKGPIELSLEAILASHYELIYSSEYNHIKLYRKVESI